MQPEEAQEPSWGTAKGAGHFDHAVAQEHVNVQRSVGVGE